MEKSDRLEILFFLINKTTRIQVFSFVLGLKKNCTLQLPYYAFYKYRKER